MPVAAVAYMALQHFARPMSHRWPMRYVEHLFQQEFSMTFARFSALVAAAGLTALLSGCVVAPVGYRPVGVYQAPPVYAEPAPVVVVPAPGYYGYRGYYGHHHRYWR